MKVSEITDGGRVGLWICMFGLIGFWTMFLSWLF